MVRVVLRSEAQIALVVGVGNAVQVELVIRCPPLHRLPEHRMGDEDLFEYEVVHRTTSPALPMCPGSSGSTVAGVTMQLSTPVSKTGSQ